MSYVFKLYIEKEASKLILSRDNKEVARKEWSEARDMGRRLFGVIDELLEENGIRPTDVDGIVVESTLPEIYTSTRIAETVQKVYAFGVRVKTDKKG